MKIYFDVTCLMPKRLSGIGVYARELFWALQGENLQVEPVTKLSRMFKTSAVEEHLNVKSKTFLPLMAGWGRRSIIQGPDFRLLSSSSRFAKIVTIHDLAVFHQGFNAQEFREKGQASTRKMLYKEQPDIIIADTNTIASEIGNYFPEFKDQIRCISPGSDHFLKKNKEQPFVLKKSPYFLYVGHLEARKNILGIVKGFEEVARKHPSVRLVLVGKDGFQGDEIRKYISSSSFKDSIDLKGFIKDEDLASLYRSATAFVFPSFYEGFGFPVLEAMSLGCPVITSNYGAMAELAGQAALLVDPYVPDSIAAAMERVLTDSAVIPDLMHLGDQRFREFTWKKCAQNFLSLYSSL